MNILVTAGNTLAMIDRVRCITNIFSGRTGAQIAKEAWTRGHHVRLLTSHPEVLLQLPGDVPSNARWSIQSYRSFEDLREALRNNIQFDTWNAVIHSAAVSDYLAAGIYSSEGGEFLARPGGIASSGPVTMVDRAADKIKSGDAELWLRLVRAPKLVDLIRTDWQFNGILVKFKLEAGIDESELIERAEHSRLRSHADLMVANTLEGRNEWALLGAGNYERVGRGQLPGRLLAEVEKLAETPVED